MASHTPKHLPTVPDGPTGRLCMWVDSVTLDDIPQEIRARAKYLILDGLACGLVGAHLPWSEKATHVIFELEQPGDSSVFGWNKKVSALSAALLNSTFIQGFELDDWHSEAPLHSNSIVLPALFAAAEHLEHVAAQGEANSTKSSLLTTTSSSALSPTSAPPVKISGADLLLATIVGYEVGPRVGNALHGSHILSVGWHSGAVFGPAASASAVCKLLGLRADQIEDALGIACTQAGGLMSAQFESEVKRMQHGFAARNGLLAALLARGHYVGIKQVFERGYGGFLRQFSLGNERPAPGYLTAALSAGLGTTTWQTEGIRVKPYAAMAGTHGTVDCVRALQARHPRRMRELATGAAATIAARVASITIEMGEAAFHHGGWKATRPLTATGAQMSNAFVAATQLVHGHVQPAQFRHDMLDRDDIWALVDRTTCLFSPDLPTKWAQAVTITFTDEHHHDDKHDDDNDDDDVHNRSPLRALVLAQRGVEPALTNDEIVQKFRSVTAGVVPESRARQIEDLVLRLDECADLHALVDLMVGVTENPIA